MKRACAFACLSMSALLVLSAAVTTARQAQKLPAAASVTFTDVTKQAGIAWQHVNGATPEKYLIETMGGGGGFLDYDGINGGPPVLLRNDGGNRNAWIGFDLRGTVSGQDAFGAVVTITAAGRRQVREKVGGASYLAAQDPRILIGLADAKKVDKVEVRWPSGATTVLENLPVGRYVLVEEPANKPAASAMQRAPVED